MKKLLLSLIFLLIIYSTNAQFRNYRQSAKHIQGTFSLGSAYGTSQNGQILNFEFVEYFTPERQGRYVFELETGKIKTTNYDNYRLIVSYQYNILDINSSVFINLRTGGVVAYESQKNQFLNETDQNFVGGVMGGIDTEIFLTNVLAITLNVQQLCLINSKLGKFNSSATIGARYSF